MNFAKIGLQEMLLGMVPISVLGLYAAALVASILRTLSDGGFRALDSSLILGQMAVLVVLTLALSQEESELTFTSLSIFGVGCAGSFLLGVMVARSGLPSLGGAGQAKNSDATKKIFFEQLPGKLQLKVKKSGSNESVGTSPQTSLVGSRVSSASKVYGDEAVTPPSVAAGTATKPTSGGAAAALEPSFSTKVPGTDENSRASFEHSTSISSDSTMQREQVSSARTTRRISMSKIASEVARESSISGISPEERSAIDLSTDIARQTLFALIGLPGVSEAMINKYSSRRWALARSSNTTHIWISKEKKSDGILLRGSSFTKLDSESVMRWLSENERVTGIDGLCSTMDVQFRTVESGTKNLITVRRLVVKSTSVMRSKRDFVVISCVSILNDGTHIVTSRSFAEDFEAPSKNRKDKGCLRGVVYGSGYILHPWKSTDGSESGCEISYACHVDMKGAGASNAQKAEPLADAVMQTLTKLRELGNQQCDSDENGVFSDVDAESVNEDVVETTRQTSSSTYSELASVDDNSRPKRPSVTDSPAFDREEVNDAISLGKRTLRDMKRLHEVYMRGAPSSSGPSSGEGTDSKKAWEVHHDENGITVKELSNYGNMGVLSASVTTSAAPHAVKKLLHDMPAAVDSLLEGRAVLSRLDPFTHIQYLAYGAIWPIGARDFLLVTTEDVYDVKADTGFVIASTSIDEIIELEGVEEAGLSKMYTRSTLKLAGFVGVQNKQGGTDLTMFVDIGVAAYMPAWLLQVLAQYGLSEMMMKIKTFSEGSALGVPGQFDFGKILEGVQTNDERVMRFMRKPEDDAPDGERRVGACTTFTAVKRGAATDALNPRTPRRSSMALSDKARPDMSEIVAMADKEDGLIDDESESDAGSRGRVRTISALSGEFNGAAEEEDNSLPPREVTPYDHHLPKFEEVALDAISMMKMSLGHMPDTRNMGLQWERKLDNKTVTVDCSPVNGSDWAAIKGITMARHADIEDIIALLSNDERTKEYDNMFDKHTFLCEGATEPYFKVRLVQMSGIWPTAPREFIVLSVRKDESNGTVYMCSRSPTHDVIEPQSKGYVRGQVQISGYCLQPYNTFDDSNRPPGMGVDDIQITLCAHTELGGTLPSTVVNRLSTGAPVNILTAITGVVNNKKK